MSQYTLDSTVTDLILQSIQEDTLIDALLPPRATIAAATGILGITALRGGTIYTCGNGGSMADAMHFASELTGRYRKDRHPMRAVSISDPCHLTCVGNDYGFDEVFSRYIKGNGRPGDALLAISTSGNSLNVLKAVMEAKRQRMAIVVLTSNVADKNDLVAAVWGYDPGAILTVDCNGTKFADRIQEQHVRLIHLMVKGIERYLTYPTE